MLEIKLFQFSAVFFNLWMGDSDKIIWSNIQISTLHQMDLQATKLEFSKVFFTELITSVMMNIWRRKTIF